MEEVVELLGGKNELSGIEGRKFLLPLPEIITRSEVKRLVAFIHELCNSCCEGLLVKVME